MAEKKINVFPSENANAPLVVVNATGDEGEIIYNAIGEPGMKERLYIMQSATELRWLLYGISIGMMIFPLGHPCLFSGMESLSEAWLTGMLQSFPALSYLE